MIERINLTNEDILEQLWRLQHAAYRVEAQLIGFEQIPPLLETMETLRKCEELFIGYFINEELAGSISYVQDHDRELVTICRMMVDPGFFRQGIAEQLLRQVEKEVPSKLYEVATGTKNLPAIHLYEKLGFMKKGLVEVAPRVFLTEFIKSRMST